MQNLMVINSEMEQQQRSIDTIKSELVVLDGDINNLNGELKTLEEQLKERQQKYVKSMRYLAKNRTVQDKLMFIFSAKNFSQMYRRMRFVKQYADYQRGQGELVKEKQKQVDEKQSQLKQVKDEKNKKLIKGKQEHQKLLGMHDEQQKVVASLKSEQKTLESVLVQQRKKDQDLNAQIDRLIAQEIAKAKARAEAEAKKKAEEARKRKEAEIARRKARAEAAAREEARRVAEAKAAEEKAKAEAKEAQLRAQKSNAAEAKREAELAEAKARRAENRRKETERQAAEEKKRGEAEIAEAKRTKYPSQTVADSKLSGSFESNRGRLPMPITGSYRIISHYGNHTVEGTRNVVHNNKGIKIKGSAGSKARAIFQGQVSAVLSFSGITVVMVQHGSYRSVYCNLSSVNVTRGQKVKTGDILGSVGSDNVLEFQLRKNLTALNPERWLRR